VEHERHTTLIVALLRADFAFSNRNLLRVMLPCNVVRSTL